MPHHRLNSLLTQRQFQQTQQAQTDCMSWFNLLTAPALFDELEQRLPAHRERLFPPTETLAMFTAQSMSEDRSCQHAVNQAAIHRLVSGLPRCSPNTCGYCQARQRLPVELIEGMTRYVGDYLDHEQPDAWLWQGRRVRLVDGTTLRMPDTAANQASFPQQAGQKPGLGNPLCRLVGITCLSSGALLNAAVGRYQGKGGDEQTLLRAIEHSLKQGDILLGDAYYPGYFFIARMQAKGVDILMQQHGSRQRKTDFLKGLRLGKDDHLIALRKPKTKPDWMDQKDYEAAPDSLWVREFKAGKKILITTLDHPQNHSVKALQALYQQRWNIELDLRDIKATLGMGDLRCKTPEMALKEIWTFLLAYNLIRLLMLQSALVCGLKPRQISFKHSQQIWLQMNQQWDISDWDQLILICQMVGQVKVGNRPGRIEPRALKRRPKAYPILTVPRPVARQNVRDNGHPKKLK